MLRFRTAVAVGLLAVAVLAGCSSDDNKKAASPTTVAGPTGTAGGPTTTVRPVDTSFSGQNSAQFCALAKTYSEKSNLQGSAPAQLRVASQDARTAINAAVSAAPAEIKPDVQVVANAFSAVVTELEKVNYDPAKLPATAFAPLQSPTFAPSATRFQAYLRSVCNLQG